MAVPLWLLVKRILLKRLKLSYINGSQFQYMKPGDSSYHLTVEPLSFDVKKYVFVML